MIKFIKGTPDPALELTPAGVIRKPIEYFEALLKVRASEGCDDLGEFRALLVSMRAGLVSLFAYKQEVKEMTTILLPIRVSNIEGTLHAVLTGFKLSDKDLIWKEKNWAKLQAEFFQALNLIGK